MFTLEELSCKSESEAGPARHVWVPKAKEQLGPYTQNILIKCEMKASNLWQDRGRKSITTTRPQLVF